MGFDKRYRKRLLHGICLEWVRGGNLPVRAGDELGSMDAEPLMCLDTSGHVFALRGHYPYQGSCYCAGMDPLGQSCP